MLSFSASRDGLYSVKEIPYGIEALIQYRSDYRYRGFSLADDTLDIQLSSLYAISDSLDLRTATWYSTATGSGMFYEFGFMAEICKQYGRLQLASSSSYIGQSQSPLMDAFNLGARAQWEINDHLDISLTGAYDTGATGFYGNVSGNYFIAIDDESYCDISLGCSAVDHYYNRDGLNDLFTRFTFTHNINKSVSVSPYFGTSTLINNSGNGKDSLYGGFYFAVSF